MLQNRNLNWIFLGILGLVAQPGSALDYCRNTAENGEGYGPIRLDKDQPLRWEFKTGGTSCVTTRVCAEAKNAEGYGSPFWSGSKLYRKIDENWANSDFSNWCLTHSSLNPPKLGLFEHKGQKLFLAGVNLGNVQFLPFRGAPYGHSEAEIKSILRKAFADLKASGANSFRFWLHIDGSRSPAFGTATQAQEAVVSGLPTGLTEDLQWLVRTAYQDYGLLVNINLWSHDVLAVRREHNVASRDRVVHLITDDVATQAYIDRALTPLVQSLQEKMPGTNASYADGVLSWEVFNEPEGVSAYWRLYWNYQYAMQYGDYSWKRNSLSYLNDRKRTESAVDTGGSDYTPIKYRGWYFTGTLDTGSFNPYIYKDVTDDYPSEWDFLKQAIVTDKTLKTVDIPHEKVLRFVNRLAGAIHRLDPEAKVSTGTHSMPYNTDTSMPGLDYEHAPMNYYSDASLIAAGGDPQGTLDFYQVHGYPEWSDLAKDGVINMFKYPKDHWLLDKPLIVGEHWNIIGAGNEMLKPYHYEQLHDTAYAGVWGWGYFYVQETKDADGKPLRTIGKHENQDYFRQLLQNLPARLKYPVKPVAQ